jgi:hypothetical protein
MTRAAAYRCSGSVSPSAAIPASSSVVNTLEIEPSRSSERRSDPLPLPLVVSP